MRWERTGREVKANGESTTTYTSHDPEGWTIESRKRNIPHANGIGSWSHTEFFLIKPDGTEIVYARLGDAKTAAAIFAAEAAKILTW